MYNTKHFPVGHLTETAHFVIVWRRNARKGGKIHSWRSWTASNKNKTEDRPMVDCNGRLHTKNQQHLQETLLLLKFLHFLFLDSSYCLAEVFHTFVFFMASLLSGLSFY